MKKRLISISLILMMVLSLLPKVTISVWAAILPTGMWVESTETNGLPMKINVFVSDKKTSSTGNWGNKVTTTTYTSILCLPGNVDPENCYLSWDGDMQLTVDGTTYSSGSLPVPDKETQETYSFVNGRNISEFKITTYQGSPNVQKVFIEVDESGDNPTIAQMNGDKQHNVTCTGRININGQWYGMPKIKGRGNYTWKMSKDKFAYNITLDSKINFPGVTSDQTKKWSILAEVGDHSLMCNRSGFYLAEQMGIAQSTTSADVWMNGVYQGCYTVTPKYDSFVSKNGYMIENDNYEETVSVADGGDPQFTLTGLNGSGNYITVKAIGDNLLDATGLTNEAEAMNAVTADIKTWLQDAWDAIRSTNGYNNKGKHYSDYIDVVSFAKMYLMQEYVKSYDVCAGSIMFHRDGTTDNDKLIAGPLWDLDNAMGSVQKNDSLGSVGDRRSGKGEFVSKVPDTGYKTSIYKTIGKHTEFMEEVKRQYNKYRTAFDNLENDVTAMTHTITDSAQMNHKKVTNISNYNLHYYEEETILERGDPDYEQKMLATNDSKTDWPNYAANLKTYIRTRSLWFHNNYNDPEYQCEHEYEAVVTEPTCQTKGYTTYTCKFCGDTYTGDETSIIPHNYQDGHCTICGQTLLNVTFNCDSGASVTVYETQSLDSPHVENAEYANPRNSDTGFIDCSGDGQVNFVVNLEPGYELESVTAGPEGTYNKLKNPDETGIANGYRLTKVMGDVNVTVTASYTSEIPQITSHKLLLSDEIGVKFKVTVPNEFNTEGSYMEFVLTDGRTSSMQIGEAEKIDNNTYWFSCFINALELNDTITAAYHYGNDEKTEEEFSVITHIGELKNAFPENGKLKNIVDALQNYGYYLQQSGWTDKREHAEIVKVYDLDAESVDAAKSGVSNQAIVKTFNPDSEIKSVKFALTLNSGTVINVFVLTEEGLTAESENARKVGIKNINNQNYCQFDTEKIGPLNLGKTYTVTVTAGNSTAEIKVSAMSYVNAVLNGSTFTDEKKLAMTAYYNYYMAAMTYAQNN